ncbi:hypothetical protein BJ138DRAFT_1105575 [Hygrophoropsis aurantiaca]|uniref:Uncharacterized protein n=1 Tax=Hygrophoropsis aurantiaca TaxID=72124 RepID=A0ACB7ZXR5_9AGAM|nr:hypothetical protein BJ138DRAFT_1105575 [Hygrophoropsis aurantiaca]
MLRRYTYTVEEYESLYGRDPNALEYPEEGQLEGYYVKGEDTINSTPSPSPSPTPPSSDMTLSNLPDIAFLTEALEALRNHPQANQDATACDILDIPSLTEALEALQLVQANHATSATPGQPLEEEELRQQLADEIMSLRALLAAARQENQRLRGQLHFRAASHLLSPMKGVRDAASVENIAANSSCESPAANKASLCCRRVSEAFFSNLMKQRMGQPGSPRSPGLPPHLIKAGFRMCSEE